ncbi:MAG: FUSC family protein [Clostridium sp.]
MKGNKGKIVSLIISNTLMFLVIGVSVSIFKNIFGDENTYIGVTTIILTLVLLGRDLTGNFTRNLFALIGFNVILGLGSFVAYENIYLGLVINFIIIFSIAYTFSYELRKPINMMFGLHYLLMMTSQITAAQLPKRLLALIFGAIIIMAIQLLVNKNNLQKKSGKIVNKIEDNILEKMKIIRENEDKSEISKTIDNNINELKVLIYDSGKKKSHITKYGKSTINILQSLERVDILLDNLNKDEINTKNIEELEKSFKEIRSNFFNENEINKINSKHTKEWSIVFKMLSENKNKLANLKKEDKNDVDVTENVIDGFNEHIFNSKHFNLKSSRVAYGIRAGLLVSITVWITKYFGLEYGNWMVYTVFALTQPHSEYTKVKSKKRIFGTLVGCFIVFILFNIVKSPDNRMIILLATGYLTGYATDYRNIVLFATVSAISAAAIDVVNPNYIILNRVLFVAIGIVIAIIANKFIMHRNYKDEEVKMYDLENNITKLIDEKSLTKGNNISTIQNVYLIQGLVKDRIDVLDLNIKKDVIYKSKVRINEIYQKYLLMS